MLAPVLPQRLLQGAHPQVQPLGLLLQLLGPVLERVKVGVRGGLEELQVSGQALVLPGQGVEARVDALGDVEGVGDALEVVQRPLLELPELYRE